MKCYIDALEQYHKHQEMNRINNKLHPCETSMNWRENCWRKTEDVQYLDGTKVSTDARMSVWYNSFSSLNKRNTRQDVHWRQENKALPRKQHGYYHHLQDYYMPPPLPGDQLTVADLQSFQGISQPSSNVQNDVYSYTSNVSREGVWTGIGLDIKSGDGDPGASEEHPIKSCGWCAPNKCACGSGNNPWIGIYSKENYLNCDNDNHCMQSVDEFAEMFSKVSTSCDIPCDNNNDCDATDNLVMCNLSACDNLIDCKERLNEKGNLDAHADGEFILDYSGFTDNLWEKSQAILDAL